MPSFNRFPGFPALAVLFAATAIGACDEGEPAVIDSDDATADLREGPDDDASTEDTEDTELTGDSSDTADADIAIEACNGHAELCDRRLDEVAFAATHNSMSNAAEGWAPPNQNFGIERQLEDGIRGFLLDVYTEDEEVVLCHSICLLGSRPFDDALNAYRTFLDENPHEVLIFIIQDGTDVEAIGGVFEETGLDNYQYDHTLGEDWPTLRSLIEQDTRLIVTLESRDAPERGMHRFWNLGWDTPYSFESIEDFNCNENRGTKGNDLFLVNHWVSDPITTEENAMEANAYDVLSARVEGCETEGGQLPNLVAVDFYDVGALFQVVDELNGVASE